MLKIGLLDADKKTRHPFPNLALMKISAWHKSQGNHVELAVKGKHYDLAYVSKVFDDFISPPLDWTPDADQIFIGGTGTDNKENLPDHIEHMMPDYSLYGIEDTAYGFLTRGCPRGCSFCIVAGKEGRKSVNVADITEWWSGQKNIVLMDPNLLACQSHMELLEQLEATQAHIDVNQGFDCRLLTKEIIEQMNRCRINTVHFAWDFYDSADVVLKGLKLYADYGRVTKKQRMVYVLVNYDTNIWQDLDRIYTIRDMGFTPYVMIYDKAHCEPIYKKLSRWVNNKFIFWTCDRFEDYDPTKEKHGR